MAPHTAGVASLATARMHTCTSVHTGMHWHAHACMHRQRPRLHLTPTHTERHTCNACWQGNDHYKHHMKQHVTTTTCQPVQATTRSVLMTTNHAWAGPCIKLEEGHVFMSVCVCGGGGAMCVCMHSQQVRACHKPRVSSPPFSSVCVAFYGIESHLSHVLEFSHTVTSSVCSHAATPSVRPGHTLYASTLPVRPPMPHILCGHVTLSRYL